MKKIAIMLFLIVAISGCGHFETDDVNHFLPDNSRTLLIAGDTLIFKSNLNNTAKYCVRKIITGYFWVSISKKDGATNKPWETWEYEAVLIDSAAKELTQSQISVINKKNHVEAPVWTYSDLSIYPDFISLTNYANGSSFQGTGKITGKWYNMTCTSCQASSSMIILNREFTNVYYCDIDLSSCVSSGRKVISYYCNATNGLFGFIMSDGEIYELVN